MVRELVCLATDESSKADTAAASSMDVEYRSKKLLPMDCAQSEVWYSQSRLTSCERINSTASSRSLSLRRNGGGSIAEQESNHRFHFHGD